MRTSCGRVWGKPSLSSRVLSPQPGTMEQKAGSQGRDGRSQGPGAQETPDLSFTPASVRQVKPLLPGLMGGHQEDRAWTRSPGGCLPLTVVPGLSVLAGGLLPSGARGTSTQKLRTTHHEGSGCPLTPTPTMGLLSPEECCGTGTSKVCTGAALGSRMVALEPTYSPTSAWVEPGLFLRCPDLTHNYLQKTHHPPHPVHREGTQACVGLAGRQARLSSLPAHRMWKVTRPAKSEGRIQDGQASLVPEHPLCSDFL